MTIRRARKICNGIIEDRFPGYKLIMDRFSGKGYVSLWGEGRRRVEIVFPRKLAENLVAHIAEYKF